MFGFTSPMAESGTGRRGSYAKGVAKREEILTRALDVIAREGYRGASVKELADAVGLSQAGLLHYFDSKEELFTEILRKRDELDSVAAFALCGGSALYLLTYSGIRMRIERRLRVSRGRLAAALALLLLLPVATMVPALAALALVTAVWLALHAYELVWWREARAESRSVLASS